MEQVLQNLLDKHALVFFEIFHQRKLGGVEICRTMRSCATYCFISFENDLVIINSPIKLFGGNFHIKSQRRVGSE